MRLSVLVPTYRRPDDLRRCLGALRRQRRAPDQIVVVFRADDEATRTELASLAASGHVFEAVLVDRPGVVHALNSGLQAVTGDIVAITDDDAAPHPDWLQKIETAFCTIDDLGGIGGRDVIGGIPPVSATLHPRVGKVQWVGRVIGNHHIGCGPPRAVDVLKGVNCAYRVEPLRRVGFDNGMRGQGAQVHFELALGLNLVRQGWTLVYDPSILVDHYPAARHDIDQRTAFNARAVSDAVHNETLALMRHLPPLRRAVFVVWAFSCGTRSYPGLLCWALEAARRRPDTSRRLAAAWHGRALGIASWLAEVIRPPAQAVEPPSHAATS